MVHVSSSRHCTKIRFINFCPVQLEWQGGITSKGSTVTKSADFGFIPDNSTTLMPPGSPGVAREAKLSTEFEFGSLVR